MAACRITSQLLAYLHTKNILTTQDDKYIWNSRAVQKSSYIPAEWMEAAIIEVVRKLLYRCKLNMSEIYPREQSALSMLVEDHIWRQYRLDSVKSTLPLLAAQNPLVVSRDQMKEEAPIRLTLQLIRYLNTNKIIMFRGNFGNYVWCSPRYDTKREVVLPVDCVENFLTKVVLRRWLDRGFRNYMQLSEVPAEELEGLRIEADTTFAHLVKK